MSDLWNRFAAMCKVINPSSVSGGLHVPATADVLARAEATMELTIPQDLREAYLRFNGSDIGQSRILPELFASGCVGA